MEFFTQVLSGSTQLLVDPQTLALIALGTIWGVIGGGHPGGSATLAISIALPLTFAFGPIGAIAFLTAVLVGVNFGNSIPAVLIGVPGTPSAVLTAIDGYALHKRGETGLALGTMFVSSVTGQIVSVVFFVAAVIPLAQLTYSFLSPEIFAIYLLGLTAVVSLLGKNMIKGWISAAFGLTIALVGLDPINSVPRLTFGVPELRGGLQTVPVLIGLLAISELIRSSRQLFEWSELHGSSSKARFPGLRRLRRAFPAIGSGTLLGTLLGAVPGSDATAGAMISYQQAQLWSKHKDEFGKGSIEGIAANEAAQNAAQAGALIPTLGLGVPGGPTTVLILSALTLHGLLPGPQLIRETPDLLYAAAAGLLGSALFLVVVGWPIARVLAKVATLNRSTVIVCAMALIVVGTYSLNQSIFDVIVAVVAGIVGYIMLRYGYSVAAASLAVALGPGMEASLREGLLIANGDPVTFASRPITGTILALSLLLLVYGILAKRLRGRKAGPADTGADADAGQGPSGGGAVAAEKAPAKTS
jgi:putative tricarboxylic transport membrane protein